MSCGSGASSLEGRSRRRGRRGPRAPLVRGEGMDPSRSAARPTSMRCMEIRGSSVAVEEVFDTPGLDAWVACRPYEGAERGGDLHYVSLCGGGVITRLVVAD